MSHVYRSQLGTALSAHIIPEDAYLFRVQEPPGGTHWTKTMLLCLVHSIHTTNATKRSDKRLPRDTETRTGQSPAIWQLQIPLGALQRWIGLFVDTDDDRVLRRRHVEPHHIGGLGDELRIVALTPGFAPAKSIFWLAQEAPDLLLVYVAQLGRNQAPCPARDPRWRRTIPPRQNTFAGLRVVLWHGTRSRLVGQADNPSRLNRPRHRLQKNQAPSNESHPIHQCGTNAA